eukprot:3686444-Rhodomonas_salina.1
MPPRCRGRTRNLRVRSARACCEHHRQVPMQTDHGQLDARFRRTRMEASEGKSREDVGSSARPGHAVVVVRRRRGGVLA